MFNMQACKHIVQTECKHVYCMYVCFNFKQPCVHACMLIKFTTMMILDINVDLFNIFSFICSLSSYIPHHPPLFLHSLPFVIMISIFYHGQITVPRFCSFCFILLNNHNYIYSVACGRVAVFVPDLAGGLN